MRPGRTQTGMSTYQLPYISFYALHETALTINSDRDEKFSYQSEFVPVSCKSQQISDRVKKFQACMLLGQQPYIY